MRIAKEGYFGGNPQDVLNAPIDIVKTILEYEGFISDYEEEFLAINKEK